MPTSTFTRRDFATLAACLAVIAYGILNLACGTSNSQLGTSSTNEPAEPSADAPGAAAAGDDVTFISDRGSVEMTLPMVQHTREIGGELQPTDAVLSGDWFVENFSFASGQLGVARDFYDREKVLISLAHRRYDAHIVAWFEEEPPALAERYLDTRADDIVARLGDADSLLQLVPTERTQPPRSAPELEALYLDRDTLSYYDALAVELQRVHPIQRHRERIRLLLTRQYTDRGSVLVVFALASRRDDFELLRDELDAVATGAVLLGEAAPLDLNPNRELGAAGDAYAHRWSALDSGASSERAPHGAESLEALEAGAAFGAQIPAQTDVGGGWFDDADGVEPPQGL